MSSGAGRVSLLWPEIVPGNKFHGGNGADGKTGRAIPYRDDWPGEETT